MNETCQRDQFDSGGWYPKLYQGRSTDRLKFTPLKLLLGENLNAVNKEKQAMPTCGECKNRIIGFCQDEHPDGRKMFMKVEPQELACKSVEFGWKGFTPLTPRNCSTCGYFKGENQPCGWNRLAEIRVQSHMGSKCKHHKPKGQTRDDFSFAMKVSDPSFGTGRGVWSREEAEFQADQFINAGNKETSNMTTSNAIIRLADSQLNQEIVDFGGLNVDLANALTEMQAEDRKAAAKDAAKQILDVIKAADQHIEYQVGEIQRHRRQEAAAKKDISEINKAKAYGLATNNFVPLGVLTGSINAHNVLNKDLLKIDESKLPAGWDKKPEAKTAAAQ
jgi:hypothetical protein